MPSRARSEPLPDVYRVLVGVGEHKLWRRPLTTTDERTFKRIHHVTDNMDLGPFKKWMPEPPTAPSSAGPSSDDGTPKRQRTK